MPLRVFYGGTFDPVHDGHLAVARHARDALDATVRLMPAADPPHRDTPGASAMHRARMLDLAVAGERGLAVDRRELQRDGRSYSIDTVRAIRDEFGPDVPLALLIGADSLLDLPNWKNWQALFEVAHFVVAERPGSAIDGPLPEPLQGFLRERWVDSAALLHTLPAGRVMRLRQPLQPESATDVRRRIADEQPWSELVAPAVAVYIERHNLYGAGAPSPASL
ncbi:MAG: nicotinate-nucleotide adenylyltransferase [Lysobacter sp.]